MIITVTAGLYYRHTITGRVVKVLHSEVWPNPGEAPSSQSQVVYRLNDDAFPHRFESMSRAAFSRSHEGPLDWDAAIPGWKGEECPGNAGPDACSGSCGEKCCGGSGGPECCGGEGHE